MASVKTISFHKNIKIDMNHTFESITFTKYIFVENVIFNYVEVILEMNHEANIRFKITQIGQNELDLTLVGSLSNAQYSHSNRNIVTYNSILGLKYNVHPHCNPRCL